MNYPLLTRRGFGKACAAVACLSPFSCDKSTQELVLPPTDKGQWITAACWHNCGGRCVNKAFVSGGVIKRQKTDDTHPDTFDYPQQRACVRGRSQRMHVLAEDRLKYPMKRAHWKPGTGGDRSLRGKDTWERITWDEALDYVTSEIKRVKETHGNRSIFLDSYTEPNEYIRTLGLYGGYIGSWGTCSFGNWTLSPQQVGFSRTGGYDTCNDRFDFLNCDTIIFLGCNPVWASAGFSPNVFKRAKKTGTKFIGIDPVFNESYAMLDAEWIPVRPGADTALLLGVAHTLITHDDIKNPLIDWEFLKRCSIGFDAESMPDGENRGGNFKDYVLGKSDSIPKDAEWASERCGTPAETIVRLAHMLGVNNKVALLTSWSVCRTNNSDSLPQLFMTIGAMTGHMGKSGHMTGVCVHRLSANHGPALVYCSRNGLPVIDNPLGEYVNDTQVWDMILGKPYNSTGYGTHGIECKPYEMKTADIRLIFHGSGNRFQTRQGYQKAIQAHRKVEFVVVATSFFTETARFADIILPVNTEWERDGGFLYGNREMILVYSKVIDSLYESKDDQWIAAQIGIRLGLKETDIYPFNRRQQFFNMAADAMVASENGLDYGYEPLCAITQDDLSEWGVSGKPHKGRIPLKELISRGVYQVKRYMGDPYGFIAFEKFRKDPEKHPTPYSQSGKFEIFSRKLEQYINSLGYGVIKPIPAYIEPLDGYEQSFVDWKRKIKGDYPYQMITARYIKRPHTTLDNVTWLNEAFHSPVFISIQDAKEKGICSGNTVIISSKNGSILRTAAVSRRIMPGCVLHYHGGWSDYKEDEGLDYGGGENILFGVGTTGQGTSGYNTLLVSLRKYSDAPLVPDKYKPLRTLI